MLRTLKAKARGFFRACGVEMFRTRPYGVDAMRDIQKIHRHRPLETVFDVGANEGQTALEFVRHFPSAQIHSFEPFPATFDRLVGKTAAYPNIKPVQAALGEAPGHQNLYLTDYSCTHSLLRTAASAETYLGDLVKTAGELQVPLLTIDGYCQTASLTHIDLLKLDAQGYELKILSGSRRFLEERRISLVLTEVNFVQLYEEQAFFHQVYETLLQQGFQLVGLYDLNYRAGPVLSWCDALFVNADVPPLRL